MCVSKGLGLVSEEFAGKFMSQAAQKQRFSQKEEVHIDEKFYTQSFLFPDLSAEAEDFQKFLTEDLTERSHKMNLEKSGVWSN